MENAYTDGQLWRFTEELTPVSEIKCPKCGAWSPAVAWELGEVPCEDCGSHSAIVCPECGHAIDHVWQEPYEIEARLPAATRSCSS